MTNTNTTERRAGYPLPPSGLGEQAFSASERKAIADAMHRFDWPLTVAVSFVTLMNGRS